MKQLHSQYAKAKYTIVHDKSLVEFPWNNDGSPCLALVFSSWFTRGWTAVELALSKSIKVLFGPETNGRPLIKDLDDILAKDPKTSSKGHWLASQLIRRLRQPISNVGDLLAILSQRVTSWKSYRVKLAGLLARVTAHYLT
jgi:hypothetical protein